MRLPFSLLFCTALYAAPPLIHHDFEKSESGWISREPAAVQVHLVHDPGSVKNGGGALAIEYDGSSQQPGAAILPISQSLAGMRSLHLWVMSDSATAAGVVLSEKDGGRYSSLVWLEPGTWQYVELAPDDFVLLDGPKDPPDPDGKLDLNQIRAVVLVDAGQMLSLAFADRGAQIAIADHAGKHTLLMDDFEISGDAPARAKPLQHWVIDDFSHPQVDWFTLGGADLRLDSSGKVISGNCLEVAYQQMADKVTVLTHELPVMDLRGATHLAVEVASEKPATFLITLEEHGTGKEGGARYASRLRIPAGATPERRQIALSSFDPDDNGPDDANDKLDLDHLKSIAFVDITGLVGGKTSVNTIHIGKIEAVKAAAAVTE